jgi:hypothetical protein
MTRLKLITTMLAGFCGLAVQFQVNTANAQTPGTLNGINLVYFTPTDYFAFGYEICSPAGVCLYYGGQIFLYDPYGNLLWYSSMSASFTGPLSGNSQLVFQGDGNLVIRNWDLGGEATWRTGTTNWDGDPAWYMAIQDDGNFVLYDVNWHAVWAASWAQGYPCNCVFGG